MHDLNNRPKYEESFRLWWRHIDGVDNNRCVMPLVLHWNVGEDRTSFVDQSTMWTGVQHAHIAFVIDHLSRDSMEKFNGIRALSIQTENIY